MLLFCLMPYWAAGPLNHNMAVFGQAGSGKSSFIKLYVARSAVSGVRTVIIDPDGEYGPW